MCGGRHACCTPAACQGISGLGDASFGALRRRIPAGPAGRLALASALKDMPGKGFLARGRSVWCWPGPPPGRTGGDELRQSSLVVGCGGACEGESRRRGGVGTWPCRGCRGSCQPKTSAVEACVYWCAAPRGSPPRHCARPMTARAAGRGRAISGRSSRSTFGRTGRQEAQLGVAASASLGIPSDSARSGNALAGYRQHLPIPCHLEPDLCPFGGIRALRGADRNGRTATARERRRQIVTA